jgi:hypothetical protein
VRAVFGDVDAGGNVGGDLVKKEGGFSRLCNGARPLERLVSRELLDSYRINHLLIEHAFKLTDPASMSSMSILSRRHP